MLRNPALSRHSGHEQDAFPSTGHDSCCCQAMAMSLCVSNDKSSSAFDLPRLQLPTKRFSLGVLQCLLHMPQILPKFRTFAILSAVRAANSNWGMCSKHCNTYMYIYLFRNMLEILRWQCLEQNWQKDILTCPPVAYIECTCMCAHLCPLEDGMKEEECEKRAGR